MALSFSTVKNLPKMKGGMRWRIVDVTFDDSYPTGGEAVTAANFGLDTAIYGMFFCGTVAGCVPEWDNTNSKIKFYYADYDAVADGALIQLGSTSDLLDAGVLRILVLGV